MRIASNHESLKALSGLARLNKQIRSSMEKLTTGYRINKAADDPSGLAISSGMRAQIGGLDTAIQNVEDAINLIQTADSGIGELVDMNHRIRDLQVKGANAATLTYDDLIRILNEINSLRLEISRSARALSFNSKNLLDGTFNVGQAVQVGPDDGDAYRLFIEIPDLALAGYGGLGPNPVPPPPPPPTVPVSDIAESFANQITFTDLYITRLTNVRASLGVQQRRINHVVADLQTARINLSAANSRIIDADLARQISEQSKLMILSQAGTAALAQANFNNRTILQLLG